MKIIIHRGTHQIGGCITEIRSNNGNRIAIDIGENLPPTHSEAKEEKEIIVDGLNKGKSKFNAVLVTHYHGDHIGLYRKINKDIPIYIGEISLNIFKMLQNRLLSVNKIGEEDYKLLDKFHTFKNKEIIDEIKDFKVIPYMADHSAFDAHMYLIECDGKRILHTGDFRIHGQRGKAVIPMLKRYVKKVDVLICEGTTLKRTREQPMTEYELQLEATKIFKNNKYNFVMCSSTNIDRIAAIHKASISAHKMFICDNYQKDILKYVTTVTRSYLYNFSKNVYDYDKNLDSKMQKYGFVMLVRANSSSNNIMKNYPNSKFIYSQWDGYLNPEFTNYKRIQEFVPKNHIYLHTSGHADFNAIKKVCEAVKPDIIIPIHGEKPEVFYKLRFKK